MHHQFIGPAEKITRHYGIRSAIFESVLPVYAVVLLDHPQDTVLSLANRSAAARYCHDMERDVFGYDGVEE